ncbi:Acyl-CoA synthetase (AMP-forming)/AMP-acid ligase II [Streptomyces zhaozhouensis]|uniref:Acyl-CoA synthetase (AMP-forming)/AMP-acid ligase II n=1 Tax=Streptomyces zhaozhouensis TaxID=1300267 RepID=A0A286E0N3_9ACTN|nr:fatty acyl-AMP ligase [Streptomyces zhaozhouensis]SOD64433.1 Acyl-CoA synthetase (AMP-forming)/AMP-acid ligase II [Streptomyces zhaozhouensis]
MPNLRDASDLISALRDNAAEKPDEKAVFHVHDPEREDGHTALTYAELDREARRLAGPLRRRLAAGERALLQYASGTDFPVAFFGCLYAGVVPVPAPLPGSNRRERSRVKGIVRDADVRALLTCGAQLDEVAAWAEAEGLTGIPLLATDGEEVAAADADGWERPAVDRSTPALLQYTSGSTSDPKGAVITHGNLLHNVETMREAFPLPDGGRHGGWVPMHHDMGLIAHLLCGVLTGRSAVLMAPMAFLRRPHWWLRVIDRYRIGLSGAPNFAYALINDRVTDQQLTGLDLSNWRYAANGSEPINAGTLRAFAERFRPAGLRPEAAMTSYGMAEATLMVSTASFRPPLALCVRPDALERHRIVRAEPTDDRHVELVSSGPTFGLDVVIVDPSSGDRLADGEIGEIWLRGESVARGYWNNETATRGTFGATTGDGDTGYLRTGDLGTFVEGELFVTGRIKETLFLHGRNLYPQDIEHEVQRRHTEFRSLPGAAFTVPAGREGRSAEDLVITQEIRGRYSPAELTRLSTEIRQTVSREFGLPVASVALLRPGAVQRTTSGKIQRVAMRQLFLSDELRPVHLDGTPSPARPA